MPQVRIWIILFLLLTAFISQAQDENATRGWDIIERCVDEATEPPDNWTYDGTILAGGWAGIHGMNGGWETPQVLIFSEPFWISRFTLAIESNNPFFALSPNGQWFATVSGYILYEQCAGYSNGTVFFNEILVYSTVVRGELLRINYSSEYPLLLHNKVSWLDNSRLILPEIGSFQNDDYPNAVSVNPFTQEIDEINWAIPPYLESFSYQPSPNGEFAITNFPNNRLWSNYRLAETESGTTLYDLPNIDNPDSQWSHLSDSFLGVFSDGESKTLSLFHTDNEVGEVVMLTRSVADISWSQQDKWVAFIDIGDEGSTNTMYVLDIDNRLIYDPCIDATSLVFSPNANQIAYIDNPINRFDMTNKPVEILDIEQWQTYTVSYHRGQLIGWREDPE